MAPLVKYTCDVATRAVRSSTARAMASTRSEEHTSELQSRLHLVCRLLLEKKNSFITLMTGMGSHRLKQLRWELINIRCLTNGTSLFFTTKPELQEHWFVLFKIVQVVFLFL